MKFRIIRPLLRVWKSNTYTPGILGRSLGVGMVLGFSPTVGLQVLLCLGIVFAWNRLGRVRLSLPPALVGSLVVNPITMGPTYFVYYKLGCLFITCEGEWSIERFGSLSSIGEVGWTILIALAVGSVPFMIAGGFVGYFLGNRLESFLQNRRAKRRRLSQATR